MVWTIEFDNRAVKDLKKLSNNDKKQILSHLKEIANSDDKPRLFGKPLTNDKVGLWRYRIGKYRIICQINNNCLKILVVRIGKRDEVYKN